MVPRHLPRTGLRLRITLLVVGYMLLLSLAVVYHGNAVNERAESVVWRSLLQAELDRHLDLRAEEPAYRWRDRGDFSLYGAAEGAPLPAQLATLSRGLHDEVRLDGRRKVALVHIAGGQHLVLTLDVTDFEAEERHLTTVMIGSALGGLSIAGLLIAWGLRRLVKPLSDLSDDIGRLRPDKSDERVAVGRRASAELVVIADAINGYLERNERFVERERAFINSASHELRTPIAVIGGAADLALSQEGVPAVARLQIQRVQRTARGVEQLVSLLLVLARDPARLSTLEDLVALDELLPEIVEDHLHLSREKDLRLVVAKLPAVAVVAPLAIVQAAIGNLVRNAIENSDRGDIEVSLRDDGVVVIDDPGHGMTPEEISAIHSRMARGDGGQGDGIGLDLIARLCEHLGWRLHIEPRTPRGTRVTLDLGAARVGSRHL